MTNEEFKVLTDEYMAAHKEYEDYVERFFTTYFNGVLENQADKSFTPEEVEKVEKMWKRVEELHKQWLNAALPK